MKKILLSMAAVTALIGASAPAMAQPYGGDRHRGGYDQGYDRNDGRQLEWRIERALQRHQISYREAQRLRSDLRATQRLEWRYRRNDGRLSGWERADLDRRYDRIGIQLRIDRHDRDYGHGYGGGYRR